MLPLHYIPSAAHPVRCACCAPAGHPACHYHDSQARVPAPPDCAQPAARGDGGCGGGAVVPAGGERLVLLVLEAPSSLYTSAAARRSPITLPLPSNPPRPLHSNRTLPVLQLDVGVTEEQAKAGLPVFLEYCAQVEQLASESAASLATVRQIQQVSLGDGREWWEAWPLFARSSSQALRGNQGSAVVDRSPGVVNRLLRGPAAARGAVRPDDPTPPCLPACPAPPCPVQTLSQNLLSLDSGLRCELTWGTCPYMELGGG